MAKKIFGEEIGAWTELKLEYIRKYLGAYSNILNLAGFKEYYFVDTFAGSGICRSKKTKKAVPGSPMIALSIQPSFTKYFFIELDHNKIMKLEEMRKKYFPQKDIIITEGDCNIKIDSILNQIRDDIPFVALLDPQAGDLYWETIHKISLKKKAEVLINFPLGMAIRRYMPLTKGKEVSENMEEKLNKIFGNDNNWKQIYLERKKGTISPVVAREKYLDLYLNNLLSTGFQYYAVKDIKNSLGNHIYYLIFGSKHIKGLEKMKDVIVKDETERNTLFFIQDLASKIYRTFHGERNLNLNIILEKLLPGKHLYRKQDFKNALIVLERKKKLKRAKTRKNARSFQDNESFGIL